MEKLPQTDQNYKELKWNGQLSWKALTIKPHSEKKIDNLNILISTKKNVFTVKNLSMAEGRKRELSGLAIFTD